MTRSIEFIALVINIYALWNVPRLAPAVKKNYAEIKFNIRNIRNTLPHYLSQ